MMNNINTSSLEPLYDKTVQCLFCEQLFTSKKVRSRFVRPLKTDSDFGPLFGIDDKNNPLFYFVAVCPHCGFSFTGDFSKHIGQISKKKVQQEITNKMDKSSNFCGARDFDKAVKAYKLAIYSAQLVGEKHIIFANLCLRLAWLNRGVENTAEEMRFLELAVSEFELSFIHTDFDSEIIPEIHILYLIGEINHKLGKYDEAVKYFSAVIEHSDKSRYVKFVNLAREQWKITVEEYRKRKNNS